MILKYRMNRMNRILLHSRRSISTTTFKHTSFHMIPYEEQYESRDNENEIKKRKKIEMSIERQKEIKEFLDNYNPYSNTKNTSHVSENLCPTLKYYYQSKYTNR